MNPASSALLQHRLANADRILEEMKGLEADNSKAVFMRQRATMQGLHLDLNERSQPLRRRRP
jgi:hypothetical protein